MQSIDTLVDQLVATAGDLWFAALIGQFFVIVCESAKPKAAEGEDQSAPQGFALLVMIMSLVTPLLLFMHAVLSGSGAWIAVVVALFGAVITATIVGWIIRAMFRMTSIVAGFGALILALGVALPRIDTAWAAAQTERLVDAAEALAP